MATRAIAKVGLLLDGHNLPPGDAITVAETWLRDRGVDDWTIYEARPEMQPRRAWWDDYRGFVGEGWDEGVAAPVTVVHLPPSLLANPALAGA